VKEAHYPRFLTDALIRGAERDSSPCLINSAATCRAVACLLTELEEEEEEDPAGGFGLPAGFPASSVKGSPNLNAFFTQRSTFPSVSHLLLCQWLNPVAK
jgi:hypothetical protein